MASFSPSSCRSSFPRCHFLLLFMWLLGTVQSQSVNEPESSGLDLTPSSVFAMAISPINQQLHFAATRYLQDTIAASINLHANDQSYIDVEAVVQEADLQSQSSVLSLRFFVLVTRSSEPVDGFSPVAKLNSDVEATFSSVSGKNFFLAELIDGDVDLFKEVKNVAVASVLPGSQPSSNSTGTASNRLLSTRDIIIIVIGGIIILGVCITFLIQFWDQGHAHHALVRAANLDREGGSTGDKVGGQVDAAPDTPSTIASGGEFNVSPETPERVHVITSVISSPSPNRGRGDDAPTLILSSNTPNKPSELPVFATPNWKLALVESSKDTPPVLQNNHFQEESAAFERETDEEAGDQTPLKIGSDDQLASQSVSTACDGTEHDDIESMESSESSSGESFGSQNTSDSSSSGYESMQTDDPEDPFGVGSLGEDTATSSARSSVGDWIQSICVVPSDKSNSTTSNSETTSTIEDPGLGVRAMGSPMNLEAEMEKSREAVTVADDQSVLEEKDCSTV